MDIKKIVFKNLDGSLRKANIVNSINGIDIPESGAVILDTIKDISADGSSLTVTKSDGSSSKVTLNASGGVKTVNSVQPDESGNITIQTGTVNSVNNVQPDESGNVLLNVVKTVNNTEPDSNGNVTIEAGKVKTVNNVQPDSDGNIEIPTGTVKTVNSVEPDSEGNVVLSVVKTVNGNTPDISGNVTIEAGKVKTVDGKVPDTNGNVALNAIKSINGSTPNANGDFELNTVSDITLSGKNLNIESTDGNTKTLTLPFSNVKTVNNVQPDSNGNVEITTSGADLSGVVKSVNNIQPDSNGNVDITIPKPITNIVGVTNNRNLGEIFTSSIPLESSQVHSLDGSVLTDSSELYDYLESIKDSNPDLFTTDSEFNSEVQSSGKCNKFVINTDNKTVRIPKGDSNNYIVIKNYDTKFEFNQPFSLLEPKWSDVPLNNLSWLLSNGQVNSSKNYPSVYELLLNEYNSGELKTETISGSTIQYKQLGNGHKIVTDKTTYNSILSKTGTAWYYLLDLEAKTFVLPQTNGYMKFGNSNEFVKESLPNLKGQTEWAQSSGDEATTPPFYKISTSEYGSTSGNGSAYPAKFTRFGINASTYSDVYQDGASVRPNSVQGYLYFYVGDCVGTSNSVNLGDIKDKLDLDVNNIKTELTTLKSDISSYAFPGPKYEELTIPSSKTRLIAPENGWFMYQSFGSGSTNDYVYMQNNSNLLQSVMTRDIVGRGVHVSLPAKKGDQVYFEWVDSATTRKLRFIYASDKV